MNLSWYLARAGGLVAWTLLTASVVWGLVLSTKLMRSRPGPAWTLSLHRFLGTAAVCFTAVHLGALVGDTYVHFGLAELVIPLAARWHPVAVAWGVIAVYLLIVIEVTSLFMRRLSNRTWKRIHRSSFVLFALTSIHAFAAGTDTRSPLLLVAALGVTAMVSVLWLQRVITSKRVPGPTRSHRGGVRGHAGRRTVRSGTPELTEPMSVK